MIDDSQLKYLQKSMIEKALDSFDFDKVRSVMKNEVLTVPGTVTSCDGGEVKVPSVYRMVETCKKLLNDVCRLHDQCGMFVTAESYGFHASCDVDGNVRLWYELTGIEALLDDDK